MSRYEAFIDRARGRRPLGAAPALSRWAWAADGLLALALAIATVIGDLNRSYVEVWPDLDDLPAPPPVPDPVTGELLPPPLPSAVPWKTGAPHPVPAVEHVLPPVDTWEMAAALLTALPLVLRRRFPLAVFWVVTGAAVLLHLGDVSEDATKVTFVSGLVAAYSAAMYSPHRKAVSASLAAGLVPYAVLPLVPDVDGGLVLVLVLLPLALATHGVHLWRQRTRELREEQEAALHRAVEAERSRIARELHDVVTHNVSMMTIQAGAARMVLDSSPDQAREAIRAVEEAGRTAMSELRHVMGLLTMAADGPDPAADVDLAPQPGLDRLTELTDRVRSSGVPVEVETRGVPAALPAGVDLAAYRVVQEALTNVVRHAPGARVSVTVEYGPDRLLVEVMDTGGRARGSADPEPGGGHGLLGLRERLAIYGGTLRTGARPGGGYRVRAVIPVEAP
ncbi:sensor histidine kinase [Streptomyces sp. NBC_00094]|uniref:sensor histidine kinase n=1 Tax=Streptomyces sp. NBC_00094 TaxID=2903620 RepID=UPI00225198D8|nr:histidine kinase [Streptomyces sp. NBC_00094]MCX5389246.1 histidine kinase [Streptomyces sp. NBC_00094]